MILTGLSYKQRKEKVAKRKENQQHNHYFKELLTIFVNNNANLNERKELIFSSLRSLRFSLRTLREIFISL